MMAGISDRIDKVTVSEAAHTMGYDSPETEKPCGRCRGTGWMNCPHCKRTGTQVARCGKCNGAGEVSCKKCAGKGRVDNQPGNP